jgi:protein-S-isoprenylcysteine O-methyltransferase Ste14
VDAFGRGGRVTVDTTIGGWFFKYRSLTPIPIALVLLAVPAMTLARPLWPLGVVLVILGQAIRMWTVRHIGVISRTRASRLGPLVVSGPYLLVRNPIYVGNWFLWTGFTIWSGVLWMLPVVWIVFVLQHRTIVRWEEKLLLEKFGEPYAEYLKTVNRWWPSGVIVPAGSPAAPHSWSDVLFSERGTMIAVTATSALMIAKQLAR